MITIIKRWHKLFVGGNGLVTNGITVRTNEPLPAGYSREWPINDSTFRFHKQEVMDYIGLDEAQYQELLSELENLERQLPQTATR